VTDFSRLLQQDVPAAIKGLPLGAGQLTLGQVGRQGWTLRDLPLPVVVLRASALEHNLRLMQGWAEAHGALLAPHGKTTMAPQLFARQLELGAWAITVATAQQLQVAYDHGVRRVLMANQLVDPVSLRRLCTLLSSDPGFELLVYADSGKGVRLLADAATQASLDRPLDVLLEVGHVGGRTGTRSIEQTDAVAQAVTAAGGRLRLRGVSGFEGLVPVQRFSASAGDGGDQVQALLADMAQTYTRLHDRRLLAEQHILTAGGSAAFDAVVDVLGPALRPGGRLVLRSGCYVTHDHGMYAGTSPLQASPDLPAEHALLPALELWSHVQSTPEPGLALLSFGRRDTGHDYGFPLPLRHLGGADLSGASISALNDQHAYLRLPDGVQVEVGDVVVCGISHPCTTFDKWRLLPVLDDEDHVVDVVATFF
jgi:D-serine dehydratase